jgi:hypothetical protein
MIALAPFAVAALLLLWLTGEPVTALLLGVLVEVTAGICLARLSGAGPGLATSLVRSAARLLPPMERQRYEAEWIDHVQSEADPLAGIGAAISIALLAAPTLAIGVRVGHAAATTDRPPLIDRALIRQLAAAPSLLDDLDPDRFEALVGSLLARDGRRVTRAAHRADGGYDLYLAERSGVRRSEALVVVKRWRGPIVAAQLLEALGRSRVEGMAKTIVVTTSSFTCEARLVQARIPSQLQLCDRRDLDELIRRAADV